MNLQREYKYEKKPHQKKGELVKVFNDYRKNTNYLSLGGNDTYHICKTKKGYTVTVNRERGQNETYTFTTKDEAQAYVKSLK